MSNRPKKKAPSRVTAARGDANRARTLWIVIGVVVVVMVAAIVAIAASSSDKEVAGGGASPSGGTVVASGDLNFGTVDVSGTALAQRPKTATEADTALGETIPTVAGQQFDGSAISIAPGGKPKILMFVAHWCPHCQAEVPRIQEWLDASGMPSDVDLYAVATGTDASRSNYPPGKWLRSKGWSVPTMVDDEEFTASSAFGLSAYPFFVVVDSSGQVVARTSGELSEDQWNGLLEAARTGTAPVTDTAGQSSPSG